ncbi:conserved hypothetical protein [uncultured Desulfobacterium sp.]|uniref:Uncharacterized protein n=1 Tax=uncultured Desulfobacterium sp. TaxID=201089 RepID=A0A445MYC9_9BACT|nr:conserved hypothetical protein [uncultured Desulfobacterium sp.]
MGLRYLWDRLLGHFQRDREIRRDRAALDEEIERFIQEVYPAIRNARGYLKQLRSPVEKAKNYIDQLVAAIPGPLPLSASDWGKGSPVELLFAEAKQVRDLFKNCGVLQSFFQKNPTDQSVALLTATLKEKTVFANELVGEITRRDVPHLAVDFTDHRIVGPSVTEMLNRRAVSEGALRLLGLRAMEYLTNLKSQEKDLAEEKRLLGVKLKILQAHSHSLEGLVESDRQSEVKAAEIKKLLTEISRQLDTVTAVLGTPEEALKHLLPVLDNPEQVMKFRPLTLRLDWRSFKVDKDAVDPGKEISLAELEIKDRLTRVALLVTIRRYEVLN